MNEDKKASGFLSKLGWVAVFAGAAVFIYGVKNAPEQAWPNFLLTFFMLVGFGLAGGLFLAMHDAIGGHWADRLRRIPEAMAITVPQLAVLVLVLLAGIPVLYGWSLPNAAATDPVLAMKQGWLNFRFFSLRSVLYLLLWTAATLAMVRNSRSSRPDRKSRGVVRAVLFLIVFGATFPLASTDWIMSIEPHFYSTIFGVYTFSGIYQSGLAMFILILLAMKRKGVRTEPVTDSQLHDLGKLLFAFSCFWVYMWFSQYMLIWYANLPDEISYYTNRQGGWFVLMLVLVTVNFVVPFFALMAESSKRNPKVLAWTSVIVLIGHWLDLYWMILPPFQGNSPKLGLQEIVLPLAGISLFLLLFFSTYRRAVLAQPET